MRLQSNQFKQKLRAGQPQLGLWQGLANPYTAELCASLGYDWLLIDSEHVPNTLDSILAQLQAVAAYPVASVVRPAWNDPVELKRLLDIGAQNLLIPMIQNAEEAYRAVQAVRYPPHGKRGVGAALARAARWGGISDYVEQADEQICVLCQVETAEAMTQLDEILGVDGVDGVFIGPADLAASMGYRGQANHPEVQHAINEAIVRIRKAQKAPGILQTDVQAAKSYLELGALFVAVGIDAGLLRRAALDLLHQFRDADDPGSV